MDGNQEEEGKKDLKRNRKQRIIRSRMPKIDEVSPQKKKTIPKKGKSPMCTDSSHKKVGGNSREPKTRNKGKVSMKTATEEKILHRE